jgi:hypothetical protein
MIADVIDKPLEKSSEEDDASPQPTSPISHTTRSDVSPLPLLPSPPPRLAREEERRQQEKIWQWREKTPYAEASPPGKHAQAASMGAKSRPLGMAFQCYADCRSTKRHKQPPPTSRSRTTATKSSPPACHHGRPRGEDQTTATSRFERRE